MKCSIQYTCTCMLKIVYYSEPKIHVGVYKEEFYWVLHYCINGNWYGVGRTQMLHILLYDINENSTHWCTFNLAFTTPMSFASILFGMTS